MFDYGVTDEGEFFYVMELLEGMSLAELIRLENGMPPARAVYLLRQACLSLAEAHTRGLVHRDIKPDNLFVCRWIAQTDFLKVLDFGIVKRVGESGTMATAQGLAIGTPSYMAPEIAQGGEATMASDLYSLGCVLYRMLTGKRVFEVEGGQMQQMMAHIERTPVPPSEIALRPVPRELDSLVLALLEKDPARRVGTAMQLYERLGALKLLDSWTESDALDWWETRERGVRA
jgi:serine/threonine-protein kinase